MHTGAKLRSSARYNRDNSRSAQRTLTHSSAPTRTPHAKPLTARAHAVQPHHDDNLLGSVRLEEGNKIDAVCFLLEASEDHLGSFDVLLRVEQVLEECLVAPGNARVLVGCCVRVALDGAALAAEEAPQVRPLLGGASLFVCAWLCGGGSYGRAVRWGGARRQRQVGVDDGLCVAVGMGGYGAERVGRKGGEEGETGGGKARVFSELVAMESGATQPGK